MKKLLLFSLIILYFIHGNGQTVEVEKTYDIQGKADIGDNFFTYYDTVSGSCDFTFVIKAKPGRITIENFRFDKDFDLISSSQDELELDSVKEKYPWWDYNGEKYTTEAIYVDENDNLTLMRKVIENTYDWKKLQYISKPEVKENLKLKSDKDRAYFHHRNWWSTDDVQTVYVLCSDGGNPGGGPGGFPFPSNLPRPPIPGIKHFPGGEGKSSNLSYKLIKIDRELSIMKEIEIKFDFPQEIVYPRFLNKKTDSKENSFDRDLILVFAPKDVGKKKSDPDKTKFTFIRINKELEVIDRIIFNSPSAFWSIEDQLIDQKTGAVYLFGSSLQSKDKYFDDLKETKKFDGFEVMKVSDHKIGYISQFSIDELEKSIVMPPSQKNSDKYEGKKFFFSNYTLMFQ